MKQLSFRLSVVGLAVVWFSVAAVADVNQAYVDPAGGWTYSFLGDGDAYAYTEYTDPQYGKQQYAELDTHHLDGNWASVNGLEQWDHGESGENRLIGTSIPEYIAPGFTGPLPAGAAQGPAPGGILAVEQSGTDYLRIQSVGDTRNIWGPGETGWQHDSESQINSYAETWSTNRKLLFQSDISARGTTNLSIVDDGVTLSFRARLSTAAADPDAALDPLFPSQDPESPIAFGTVGPHDWATGGDGDILSHHGNGHFGICQSWGYPGVERSIYGAQIGFSLARNNDLAEYGAGALGSGLIMNDTKTDVITDPNTTNMQTNSGSTNIVSIPDGELDQWHEFWITIEEDGITGNDATHEVNVYLDGSETPQTFYVTASGMSPAVDDWYFGDFDPENPENPDEYQWLQTSYLEMGHTRMWNSSAIDVDFFSYKEGILVPTAAGLAGDFDVDGDVDGADFLLWQRGLGDGYDANDLAVWRANFGAPGALAAAAAVPEPATVALLGAALLLGPVGGFGRRRWGH